MQLNQQDVDAIIGIARAAGDLVQRMQQQGLAATRTKSSEIDLVTEADVACEAFLRSALAQMYPSVELWGEESNRRPTGDYFWLVDPIDGTTNYAHGVAYCSVNIALQHGDDTLLGVTYHLGLDWIFFARPGEGAWVRKPHGHEHRLQVNTAATLRAAVLITGFPYHRAEAEDNNSAEFAHFMPRTSGVRNLGSAALDLAHVAMGAAAGYWEGWLNPWDLAAGTLIVREAGGQVTTYDGRAWTIADNTIVATNGQPTLHAAMLDGIRVARSGLKESRLSMPV